VTKKGRRGVTGEKGDGFPYTDRTQFEYSFKPSRKGGENLDLCGDGIRATDDEGFHWRGGPELFCLVSGGERESETKTRAKTHYLEGIREISGKTKDKKMPKQGSQSKLTRTLADSGGMVKGGLTKSGTHPRRFGQ